MSKNMAIGYGLDLAGYSSRGSSLARAERMENGKTTVTVFSSCCFAARTKGSDRLKDVNDAELMQMKDCLRKGRLSVDVCIDLQSLRTPASAEFVWQLIRRPVVVNA